MAYLPGQFIAPEKGAKCERHPKKNATHAMVGEVDSFGHEVVNMCQKCYNFHLRSKEKAEPIKGCCKWCNAKDVVVKPTRDYEEGLNGPIYDVCDDCRKNQSDLVSEESDIVDVTGSRWEEVDYGGNVAANDSIESEDTNQSIDYLSNDICALNPPLDSSAVLEATQPINYGNVQMLSDTATGMHPLGYGFPTVLVKSEATGTVLNPVPLLQPYEGNVVRDDYILSLEEKILALMKIGAYQAALIVNDKVTKCEYGDLTLPELAVGTLLQCGFTVEDISNNDVLLDLFTEAYNKLI